jgi:hypothetical protein
MSDNLGDVDKSQNGNSNNRNEIDLGGVPAWANAVLASAAITLSVVAILFVWWTNDRAAADAERRKNEIVAAELARAKEYKQIQVQLMYSNAILLREGLAKPGDMVFGPEGNLEYLGGFKFSKEKEQ